MMKLMRLMSLMLALALKASLSFAGGDVWGAGQVFECQLRDLYAVSTNQKIEAEVAASFDFYASIRSSGVSRVIFRIPQASPNSMSGSSYAIQIMKSLEGSDQGWVRGSVSSLESGRSAVMVNNSPLSMLFRIEDVMGQVNCRPSEHRYAFINMETRLETDVHAISQIDSLTVATVPRFEHMLLEQGYIDTVNGGTVSNIATAFAQDRICLMGSAEDAMVALLASAAFPSKDTLVLKPYGLEFQVDQVVGCLQIAVDVEGHEICKIPKYKKNGNRIRIPLCE
jgi:hypothetical protein